MIIIPREVTEDKMGPMQVNIMKEKEMWVSGRCKVRISGRQEGP